MKKRRVKIKLTTKLRRRAIKRKVEGDKLEEVRNVNLSKNYWRITRMKE